MRRSNRSCTVRRSKSKRPTSRRWCAPICSIASVPMPTPLATKRSRRSTAACRRCRASGARSAARVRPAPWLSRPGRSRRTCQRSAREKEWSQAARGISGARRPRSRRWSWRSTNAAQLRASRAHGRINLPWSGMSWARAPLPMAASVRPLQRAGDALSPATSSTSRRSGPATGAWCRCRKRRARSSRWIRRTAAIAALVGGFDYFASNFNRAVQAKRQPGSAFKPFLYSAALEQGFTPASIVNDAPLVIEDPTLEATLATAEQHARIPRPDALARSAGAFAQSGFDSRDARARPGVRDASTSSASAFRRTACRAISRSHSARRRCRRSRWRARTRCSRTAAIRVEPYYIATHRSVRTASIVVRSRSRSFACRGVLRAQRHGRRGCCARGESLEAPIRADTTTRRAGAD